MIKLIMLNSIYLKNFKSFKELKELELKPITILSGTNSCGKSSILQSILLLKQTLESKNINQTALLNGRFVHLGVFENLIYEKNAKESITFRLKFKISKEDYSAKARGDIPLHYYLRDLLSEEHYDLPKAEYLFTYTITLKISDSEKKKSYVKPIKVESIHYLSEIVTQEKKKYKGSEISICENLDNKIDNLFTISWKNLTNKRFDKEGSEKSGSEKGTIRFINLFPSNFEFNNGENITRDFFPIEITFHYFQQLLRYTTSKISYIGPLREEPSRRYIYEDEVIEIGIKGENAAYIFLSEQDEIIEKLFFFDSNTEKFIPESNISLAEAIRKWTTLMNINGFKADPQNELIQLNLDSNSGKKTTVNIADVGFGVSQIFPIILEGIRIPHGGTLLLEQPEIHLHPNLQMQLADYLLALALSGKNIIAETHSDHLINRLIRRIVEDNVYNLRDLVAIYFIRPSENGAFFEEIEIDAVNGIINWPDDFFDQTASEQEKIIKASISKRQSLRK